MEHHYVESLWLPDTDNRTLRIPPKRITAYHESGHAVACYRLFHRLECVTIVATSEHRGLVPWRKIGKTYRLHARQNSNALTLQNSRRW